MRIILLILLCLVIICHGDEAGFNHFSSTFSDAIRKPLSFTWQQNLALEEFRHDFANIIEKFLNKILLQYYIAGSDYSKTNYRMDYCIRQLTLRDKPLMNETVNDSLIEINSILNSYFKILPNFNDTAQQTFNPLPPFQPTKYWKNYELSYLFRYLDKILDENLLKFYLLFGNLYLEGWKATRPVLRTVKNRFAKTYLYGVILERLVKDVNRISAIQEEIRPLANRDIWQNFTSHSDNLSQLFDKNFIKYY